MLEIEDILNSHERGKVESLKETVNKECRLARFIAADITYSLNGEAKVVMPWDVYPELFAREKEIYEQQTSEKEFENYKQSKKEYAAIMNARRRGEV